MPKYVDTSRLTGKVNARDVENEIRSGNANIGIVAHNTSVSPTQSFLVITNEQNEVVDVVQISKGMKDISLQRPILIIDSTSNVDGHLQNGYYEPKNIGGVTTIQNSKIVRNDIDVSQNLFHDEKFGHTSGVNLSPHQRQMVYDATLSMLDHPEKMSSEDISSYLNRSIQMYNVYHREYGRTTREIVGETQIEKVEYANKEWESITSNKGAEGFESRIRFMANEINNEMANDFMSDYNAMHKRAYINQLEQAQAERDFDIAQMNIAYTSHSQSILINHSDLVARDGLTSQIGSHSDVSFQAIHAAIEKQKHQIDVFIHNNENSDVIKKHMDYLRELTTLEQNHPAIIANINASQNYHFIANQNIYASINDNLGGHSRTASESVEHAFVLYKDNLSQREYYDYLMDKSKIISALAFNSDGKKTNDYYQMYERQDSEHITQAEKLEQVANELKKRLAIDDSPQIDRFFKSDEFKTIMEDRTTLYATVQDKNGVGYITWNDNSSSYSVKTTPETYPTYRNLAPAYSVIASAMYEKDGTLTPKYDLSTPSGCARFEYDIRIAREREAKIYDHPSQELISQERFIKDYIQYNSLSQTANRVHAFTNGLNNERVEYSDATLAMLNGEQHKSTLKTISFLQQHGCNIDFKSMPTSDKMYSNYSALTHGFDELLTHSTTDLRQTLSHCKGLTIRSNETPELQSARLCDCCRELNQVDSPAERAKKIANLMGYDITTQNISNNDIKKINASYDQIKPMLEEINGPDLNMRTKAIQLANHVKTDLHYNIQITRGCDNLYQRNNVNHAFSNIAESDLRSAQLLDFATAIAYSDKSPREAALDVVKNHKTRNELISMIENRIEQNKLETFASLKAISHVINDEKAEKRTEQIAKALLGEQFDAFDADKKAKIVDIMRSKDFEAEVQQMLTVATNENINIKDSNYFVRLEKTYGVENYEQIINAQNVNIDYSMLGSHGYIKQFATTSNDATVSSAAANLIEQNNYTEMLVVTRNLEELVHRTAATEDEIKRAKQLAEDYAFINAVETSQDGTTVRVFKYKEMIELACDREHISSYEKAKIEDSYQTITTEAKEVQKVLSQYFQVNASNPVITLSTGEKSMGNITEVYNAIRSDEDFYRLREKIESAIRNNPNYNEMVEHNQISFKQAQINNIDKQIDKLEFRKSILEGLREEHINSRYSMRRVEQDNKELEEYNRKIDDLKQKRAQLVNSMQITTEHVEHKVMSLELFKENKDADKSVTLATNAIKNMVVLYGQDSTNRTSATRNEMIENYTPQQLLEASNKVHVHACNVEDFYRAKKVLAEAELQRACAIVDQARIKRIEEIQGEVAKNATHTEITPDIISKAIIPSLQKELNATTNEERKTELQNQIFKYHELSHELAILQKTDVFKDEVSFYQCATVLAKNDREINNVKNQYDVARDALDMSSKHLDGIDELNNLKAAYRHLEEMRVQRETLSVSELNNAANYAFGMHVTIEKADVVKQLSGQDTKQTHLAAALQELCTRESQVQQLMEKISNGDYTKLNVEELKTLQVIREYNQAAQQFSEKEMNSAINKIIESKNEEIRQRDPKADEFQKSDQQIRTMIRDFVFEPIHCNGDSDYNLTMAFKMHQDKLDVANNACKYVQNYELTTPAERAQYVSNFCDMYNKGIEPHLFSEKERVTTAFAAIAMSQYSNDELQAFFRSKNENSQIAFPSGENNPLYQAAINAIAEKSQVQGVQPFHQDDATAILNHCKDKLEHSEIQDRDTRLQHISGATDEKEHNHGESHDRQAEQ